MEKLETNIPKALGTFFNSANFGEGEGEEKHTVTLRGSEVAGDADEFGFALRTLRVEALGMNAKDRFGVESAGASLNLSFTSEAFQKMRSEFLSRGRE